MKFFSRRLLFIALLIPALAACQAMAPGTFSAKGGKDSGTTVASSEASTETSSDTPVGTPSGTPPGIGADTTGPLPAPIVSAPSPQPVSSSIPTSPPISAPGITPLMGLPASGPLPSSAPIGPLAAADDPMGPRADKEGAGDCPIAYALTQAARLHYSDPEGSIAGTDKANPTPIDLDGQTALSAHFLLEALLQSGDTWDDKPAGYVRAVITPADASGPKYVDIKLLSNYGNDPSFLEGPPDLHLGAYNLVLTNLPAPTGATIEFHYVHNIYKKALLANDPMAGNPWAACNAVIGQPPDYSETPATYTPEAQSNFDAFRAQGKIHTAAVFKIVRSKEEMMIPRERPSIRDFMKLSR